MNTRGDKRIKSPGEIKQETFDEEDLVPVEVVEVARVPQPAINRRLLPRTIWSDDSTDEEEEYEVPTGTEKDNSEYESSTSTSIAGTASIARYLDEFGSNSYGTDSSDEEDEEDEEEVSDEDEEQGIETEVLDIEGKAAEVCPLLVHACTEENYKPKPTNTTYIEIRTIVPEVRDWSKELKRSTVNFSHTTTYSIRRNFIEVKPSLEYIVSTCCVHKRYKVWHGNGDTKYDDPSADWEGVQPWSTKDHYHKYDDHLDIPVQVTQRNPYTRRACKRTLRFITYHDDPYQLAKTLEVKTYWEERNGTEVNPYFLEPTTPQHKHLQWLADTSTEIRKRVLHNVQNKLV